MLTLHSLLPPKRYAQYMEYTGQSASRRGHLLDRWTENGIFMGLWINDQEGGDDKIYVIRCPEHRYNYTDDAPALENLAIALRRRLDGDYNNNSWYVGMEHRVDPETRSMVIVGLPEMEPGNTPHIKQALDRAGGPCDHERNENDYCRWCGFDML